jgi:hypothetical protein
MPKNENQTLPADISEKSAVSENYFLRRGYKQK